MVLSPRAKMMAGALAGVIGVWWYVPGGGINSVLAPLSTVSNLESLVAGFQGVFGLLLIFVGIFVVWIERDEIRLRREMQADNAGEAAGAVQVAEDGPVSLDAEADS